MHVQCDFWEFIKPFSFGYKMMIEEGSKANEIQLAQKWCILNFHPP
jgi:hypothetical protein